MDTRDLAQVIDQLVEAGFEYPLYFAVIAQNRSMLFGEYPEQGKEGNILTSYCPSGTFTFPMNVMVMDARGEAARISFTKDKQPVILH